MHSEEEVYERFVWHNFRVECDLNCLGMARRTRADVFVGRGRGRPTGIADNDFVQLVLKVFTIQMFGAWINERDCSNSNGVYPRNSPARNVSNEPNRNGTAYVGKSSNRFSWRRHGRRSFWCRCTRSTSHSIGIQQSAALFECRDVSRRAWLWLCGRSRVTACEWHIDLDPRARIPNQLYTASMQPTEFVTFSSHNHLRPLYFNWITYR